MQFSICSGCGHSFDVPFIGAVPKKCPKCGKPTMKRDSKRIEELEAENKRLRETAQQVCDLPIESDFCTLRETVMNLQAVLTTKGK